MGAKYGGNHSPHISIIFLDCRTEQNRVMRIINFEKFDAKSDLLYKRNKLLKLEDLIEIVQALPLYPIGISRGIWFLCIIMIRDLYDTKKTLVFIPKTAASAHNREFHNGSKN